MDTFLAFEKMAQSRQEYSQISDYPETVIKILRLFVELWCIPERAIPSRHIRGRFAQWIKELQELENLGGKDWESVMKNTYEEFSKMKKQFIVSHPLAIRSLMVDIIAKQNREQRDAKQQQNPVSKVVVTEDGKKQDAKFAKGLKSIFEDDDNG